MNDAIESSRAPEPVGLYPHAKRVGDLLFLSGVGPRERGSSQIPGVELGRDGVVEDPGEAPGLDQRVDLGRGGRGRRRPSALCARRSPASRPISVDSQVKSGSVRPKCPYAAVFW